jgi:8-oxo-dGTP pyrophosphatase MutT (NUDIX family)
MKQVYYQAAGGVVVCKGEVLLLDRPDSGEVRLPKGHVEEGESSKQAALREVREETGYAHPEVIADLGTQRVCFELSCPDRQVTRDEHYFLMRLRDDKQVKRGKQDLQFVPVWTPAGEALVRLTFDAEQEFVRRALRALDGKAKV